MKFSKLPRIGLIVLFLFSLLGFPATSVSSQAPTPIATDQYLPLNYMVKIQDLAFTSTSRDDFTGVAVPGVALPKNPCIGNDSAWGLIISGNWSASNGGSPQFQINFRKNSEASPNYQIVYMITGSFASGNKTYAMLGGGSDNIMTYSGGTMNTYNKFTELAASLPNPKTYQTSSTLWETLPAHENITTMYLVSYHTAVTFTGALYGLCYGSDAQPTSTPTVTRTPTQTATFTVTPTPTPACDTPYMWREMDFMESQYFPNGIAFTKVTRNGEVFHVLDWTQQIPINGLRYGLNPATLKFRLTGVDLPVPYVEDSYLFEVTLNGMKFNLTDPESEVLIQGPASQVKVTVHAEFPDMPSITQILLMDLTLKMMMEDACDYNLLTDSDFELAIPSEKWEISPDSLYGNNLVGRVHYDTMTGFEHLFNLGPSCGRGYQRIGAWMEESYGVPTPKADAVEQGFNWPGGMMYVKWRMRYQAIMAMPIRIYLIDSAGSVIWEILGRGDGQSYIDRTWKYFNQSAEIEPGYYKIVLNQGDGAATDPLSYIAYDDLAVGIKPHLTGCYEYITDPPPPIDTPTATTTPTVLHTLTPTRTLVGTVTHAPTLTNVPGTATRTITPTARATSTRISTFTPIPSWTRVPSRTPTAYGYNVGTITPGPTATGSITPGPTTDAGFATPAPWDWMGDMPPGGTSGGTGNCSRPTNPWSLSWWIDYEFCRLEFAVSWQSYHSATLVALPSIYQDVEPIRSARMIGMGVNMMATEISGYISENDAFVDGGPQTADPSIFTAPANSPWNGAPLTLGDLPDFNAPPEPTFSSYCGHRMISIIGTLMAPGFCFVLNLMRDIGMLIWFQFLLDILAVLSVGKSILTTIQFYPLLYADGKGGKDE